MVCIYEALSKGGSWGGKECIDSIPIQTHMMESVTWVSICLVLSAVLNISSFFKTTNDATVAYFKNNQRSTWSNILNTALGFVHLSKFGLLIFYKLNIKSLINLFQPCHMIMLLQGVALLSKTTLGVNITLIMIPALVGCFVAMITPDTSGLHQQYEVEAYWAQHVLILLVPFYLLMRDDFLIARLAGFRTVFIGLWFLTLIHFVFFEAIDLATMVNVEFMLCPSSGMLESFESVLGIPREWVFPTHRTTMTFLVFVIAMPLSLVYIGTSRLLCQLLGTKQVSTKSNTATAAATVPRSATKTDEKIKKGN